jgi:hypothetical protein
MEKFPKSIKEWLILILKGVIVVALIRYLVVGIDWKIFLMALENYNLFLMVLGALLIVSNDGVQAIRWQFLSRNQCSWLASVESIIIAGFLNVVLPAKLGEISRLIYLRNFYQYPINRGIGIMVIERGADLFLVALLLLFSAWLVTDSQMVKNISIIILLGMIGTVFALKNMPIRWIRKIAFKIPIRIVAIYGLKIVNLLRRELGNKRMILVLIYTFIVRGVYFLTIVFFLTQIAGFVLSWRELLVIYLVGSLALSIPLLPGGTGTFHAGLVMAAGWYGISKENAFAIAVLYHLLLNIVPLVLAMGIIFMKKIPIAGMIRVDRTDKIAGYEE